MLQSRATLEPAMNANLSDSLARCWFCASRVEAGCAPLCPDCTAQLPRLGPDQCPRCALPLPIATLCRDCRDDPPPFGRAYIPLCYQPPVGRLIEPLKQSQHTPAASLLADLMAALVGADWRGGELLLVGVPLHPKRALQRGYSQAALLAQLIAKRLACPAPASQIQLQRCVHQPPQRGQSRRQRLANLTGCFSAAGVAGRHIGLVDDVVTTTATARAASTALIAAGAASVTLIAAARTPNSRH